MYQPLSSLVAAAAALALLSVAPGARAGTPDSIGVNFTGNSTTYSLNFGTTAGIVPTTT